MQQLLLLTSTQTVISVCPTTAHSMDHLSQHMGAPDAGMFVFLCVVGMYVCVFVYVMGMYVCLFVYVVGMYVCSFSIYI